MSTITNNGTVTDEDRRRIRNEEAILRNAGGPGAQIEEWRQSILENMGSEKRKFTLYIAGPMTGLPHFNRVAFERASRVLRVSGFNVVSPVELDDAEGIDWEAEEAAARVDPEAYRQSETHRRFLLRDLIAILENEVDAIWVLDGWEHSKGAALEVHIARAVGLPIFDERGQRVKEPTKYRPPTDENVAETAMRLVGGDRQDQYGHPIDDFTRTAGVINALFGTEFEARDIPTLMIAVKLSRMIQSPEKRDSLVDLVGYALTREMVAEKEERPLV